MFLLDTNVVSEVRRPRAARQVVGWWDSVPSSDLFLSVLVIGEIQSGVERLRPRDSVQSEVYQHWLKTLQRDFDGRVITVDSAIAEEWGRIHAATPVSLFDGLMAATAKVRDLTFVTRKSADVQRTGVRLLNPWDG